MSRQNNRSSNVSYPASKGPYKINLLSYQEPLSPPASKSPYKINFLSYQEPLSQPEIKKEIPREDIQQIIPKIVPSSQTGKDYIEFREKFDKICKLPLCKLPQYQDPNFPCSDIIKEKMCKGNCNKHHLAKGRQYCDRCAKGKCPNLNFCIEYYNLFNPVRQDQSAKDLSEKIAAHLEECPREHDFNKVIMRPKNRPCGPDNITLITKTEEQQIQRNIMQNNEMGRKLFTDRVKIKPIKQISLQEVKHNGEQLFCLSHKVIITDKNIKDHNKSGCILFKTMDNIIFESGDEKIISHGNQKLLLNIMSFNSIKDKSEEQKYWLDLLNYNLYDNLNLLASNTLNNKTLVTENEEQKYLAIFNRSIRNFEDNHDPYLDMHLMIDIFKYNKLRELNNNIYQSIQTIVKEIEKILQIKLSNIMIQGLDVDRYKGLFLSWNQDSGRTLDPLFSCEDLIKLLRNNKVPKPSELYKGSLSVETPIRNKNESDTKYNMALRKSLITMISNINNFTQKIEKLKKWINNLATDLDNFEIITTDSLIILKKLYDVMNSLLREIEEQKQIEIKELTKKNIKEIIMSLKNKDPMILDSFQKKLSEDKSRISLIDDKINNILSLLFGFNINSTTVDALLIRYIYNTKITDTNELLKLMDYIPRQSIYDIKNLIIEVIKRMANENKVDDINRKIEEFYDTFIEKYFTPTEETKEKLKHEITVFSDKGLYSLKEITDTIYKKFLIINNDGSISESKAYSGLKLNLPMKSRLTLHHLIYGIKNKDNVFNKILNGDINEEGSLQFALKVLFKDNDTIINDYLVLDKQNNVNNLIKTIEGIQNRLYRMNTIKEILISLNYNIRIFKVILEFNYNPNRPEYNEKYSNPKFGIYVNDKIRDYINIFFNCCSDRLIAKIKSGGNPGETIEINVGLNLERPQIEFSPDEMNFKASGVILDKFKSKFRPVVKEEYKDEDTDSYSIKNKRLVIKKLLELNLNALHNILKNFNIERLSDPSFLNFDLNESIIELKEEAFPTFSSLISNPKVNDSKQKYLKYKTKYLALKALL
jgi:hypothetical protein